MNPDGQEGQIRKKAGRCRSILGYGEWNDSSSDISKNNLDKNNATNGASIYVATYGHLKSYHGDQQNERTQFGRILAYKTKTKNNNK